MGEGQADDVWSPSPPDKPGDWLMLCGECDGTPEPVRVEWRRGELWAVDCAVGSLPVAMYHDGLTDCIWRQGTAQTSAGAGG